MINNSNYYFKFPEELDNRLDFIHYHPNLDFLDSLNSITPYTVVDFGGCIDDEKIISYIVSGKTPEKVKYFENGILFLGARNIKREKLDLDETVFIDHSVHDGALFSSKLEKGDILITMAGTIGRCCIYYLEEEANINQAVAKVRVNPNLVYEKYITEYLNSVYGQKGFQKYMHSVGQPNINLDEITRIKMIIPPLTTQLEILNEIKPFEIKAIELETKFKSELKTANNMILSELDIEFDENINYFFKKGQSKSDCYYIFEDELTDRLHYLFHHPKYELLKKLDDEYETILLKDICSEPIKSGEQPEYADNGKMVIKTIDLKNRFIDYGNTLRVSDEFFESKSNAHIFKGDILISSTGQGSIGKIDTYELEEPALADPQILILRLNDEYDAGFIQYYLRSPFGQIQFDKWFSGSSGQTHLYPKDLGNFIVPHIDDFALEKQQEIAQEISRKYENAIIFEEEAIKEWNTANTKFINALNIDYD